MKHGAFRISSNGVRPISRTAANAKRDEPPVSGYGSATTHDFPPINVWLGDNSVVVTAELPGVTRDHVTLNLQDDVLTLEGKREPEQRQEGLNWQRRERAYGSFSRVVQLPFRADPDKVQARFNNGILQIELERLEADRPKKIEIRAA